MLNLLTNMNSYEIATVTISVIGLIVSSGIGFAVWLTTKNIQKEQLKLQEESVNANKSKIFDEQEKYLSNLRKELSEKFDEANLILLKLFEGQVKELVFRTDTGLEYNENTKFVQLYDVVTKLSAIVNIKIGALCVYFNDFKVKVLINEKCEENWDQTLTCVICGDIVNIKGFLENVYNKFNLIEENIILKKENSFEEWNSIWINILWLSKVLSFGVLNTEHNILHPRKITLECSSHKIERINSQIK